MKNKLILLLFFLYVKFIFSDETTVINNINQNDYFNTVLTNVQNAKKSITVFLSDFNCKTDDSDDPILKIIKELIIASSSEIDIKFIINKNLNNNDIFKTSKIKVTNFNSKIIHYNLVIIDDYMVIEGSLPWLSDIDYQNNIYSNFLIISEQYVKNKISEIQKLLDSDKISDNKIKTIKIPADIFFNNVSDNFMKNSFKNLLTLYLFLLSNQNINVNYSQINFSEINSQLNLNIKSKLELKKTIINYLKKLSKFNLIDLKNEKNVECYYKISKKPDREFFNIPENFIKFNVLNFINAKESIVYLLLNYISKNLCTYPKVQISNDTKKYFKLITADEFDLILNRLEKFLLIEPNSEGYTILNPINLSLLHNQIQNLFQQYGEKNVRSAQFIAGQLNKENDLNVITDILYFQKELSLFEVQKVIRMVFDLPKFHIDRNFNTVKKILLDILNQKMKSGF